MLVFEIAKQHLFKQWSKVCTSLKAIFGAVEKNIRDDLFKLFCHTLLKFMAISLTLEYLYTFSERI